MKARLASNITLEYQDIGQGMPIVLLHGFPFSSQMWRPQVNELKERYRVITPNLRGFGGTDGFAGPPSMQQMAGDVNALLDTLAIEEPVVLGGLSMGGYVTLAFARSYAARLRGLILADTRAEADTAEGKANREKMIAFAETHSSRDVIAQMLPRLISDKTGTREPGVVQEIQSIASAQTREGIIGALKAMRDRPESALFLRDISVPTLVIVGKDDALTPVAASQGLVNGIRGAQLVVISDAGHMSNLEQPKAFSDAVAAFMQTLL